MRKVWSLPGGVHPPENKHQSTQQSITEALLPSKVVLPLQQHIGAPAEPVVAVGDQVKTGQIIAQPNGFVSAPVHASISGTVVAVTDHPIPHPSGMSDQCIVIESDGKDEWQPLNPVTNYTSVNPAELIEHIRQAGITGLGGAGFPTGAKLKARGENKVSTLIINGTECEPYITADDMLMRERAEQIVSGVQILCHLLQPNECIIGIEDNKPQAIAAMESATKGSTIQVASFPTKYPSGGEKQLIYILTGKEVPSGSLPADIGIICQNVGTAAAIHDAVIVGKPLVSRVTTLTGQALSTPKNLEVRLGTLIAELLPQAGLVDSPFNRLVMGGPMMGFTLENQAIPVVKTTNCLIAATAEEFPPAPPAQACIRCGMCDQACPASLLPQQLYWFSQSKDHEMLKHHNLFDCIECGACSFVCPSAIPLVQYYRASKGEIRHQEAMQQKAEHSKMRFEARQTRLERVAQEKEAKRKANAAKAAKLKASKAQPKDDAQAAIDRAKAKKAAGASASSKAPLSPAQKQLKIQLATVNAQIKKTQRQLEQAKEQEQDTNKLEQDLTLLNDQLKQLESSLQQAESTVDATEQPAKPKPSAEEKALKIKLAMANAALKKAKRAIDQAGEGEDIISFEQELAAQQKIVSDTEAELAKLSSQEPTPAEPPKPVKKKPAVKDEQHKKLSIELAMAKAALKKSERSYAKAAEAGSEQEEALKAEVAANQQIVNQTEDALNSYLTSQAEKHPSAQQTIPENKATKPAKKKTPLDEAEKKLKIQVAMAKANAKKAKRSLKQAEAEGQANLAELTQATSQAEQELATAEQALADYLASKAPETEV
ncbi:electron transport complex subunit RsxC [Spartinivicinus poritis]|uniref:Ion-translocating oxidoreductase complex subunit C n=1 Tax=Spartinivicinus poritis TaxID=2994640 RepID=A0ABT5U223_9GAMM|nr:electron transport complex subunit RsxC [Spartinivicinus sp. A2-2]MDE1460415.1 electron transport complex subunit RsxC [Spartinivicinus sp. A2-2]